MRQSGKIAACCSLALTAGAVLGLASLAILHDPFWSNAGERIDAGAAPVSSANTISAGPTIAAPSAPPEPVQAPVAAAATEQAESAGAGDTPVEAATPPAPQWSEREVAAALMECVHLLAPLTAEVVPLGPIRNGACGMPAPVLLRSIGDKDRIVVDPPLLISCPMILALNHWLETVVQPAARATLGSPVTRINGSGYACRNRYNLPNDRLSQHALGDAIDLPLFTLADGRHIDVTSGWGPTRRDLVAATKAKLVRVVAKGPTDTKKEKAAAPDPDTETAKADGALLTTVAVKTPAPAEAAAVKPASAGGTEQSETKPKAVPPAPDPLSAPQAKFLRWVHQGACQTFTTVLGPEANDVHRTHLHLDLQGRNGLDVCE
jgi:hypothetical protein